MARVKNTMKPKEPIAKTDLILPALTPEQIETMVDHAVDMEEAADFRITASEKPLYTSITPMIDAYRQFMAYQEGKGNTSQTIRYYKGRLKELIAFAGKRFSTVAKYKKAMKDAPIEMPVLDVEYQLGQLVPISCMTYDFFDTEYRQYLKEMGQKEQTTNSNMRAYKAFYRYCEDNKWLPHKKIVIKDIPAPIKAIYNDEELNILLRKPDYHDFIEYKCWVVINFVAATGCRIGSVVGIKMKDLELEDRSVIINIQKNRDPKRIKLVSAIIKILREYIKYYRSEADDEDFLFCNQYGEEWSSNAAANAIHVYNKKRGLKKTSIHLLRHTYAANYFKSGGDIFNLQNQLGHKSLKMVKRYADTYGVPDEAEIEEHSLINTVKKKTGRKKLEAKL